MKKLLFYCGMLLFVGLMSCQEDTPEGLVNDTFDKKALLNNWVNNIIIPSVAEMENSATALHEIATNFSNSPSLSTLAELRENWKQTYLDYQRVSPFRIGAGDDQSYHTFINVFPTDVSSINDNISSGSYNFENLSSNNEQGLPALDYLLFGLAATDNAILAFYTTNPNADSYLEYLTDITSRIKILSSEHVSYWNSNKTSFINNTSNSSNGSVSILVNDIIQTYEDHRRYKIGIPAGKFSIDPLPEKTEAYYNDEFSLTLLNEGILQIQRLFNGTSFSGVNGIGLDDYLDHLDTKRNGTNLSTIIDLSFDQSLDIADEKLTESFSSDVQNSLPDVLEVVDALQKNVVYLKTDMLQALAINIDYVDSDGD